MARRLYVFALGALALLTLEISAGAGQEGLPSGQRREFHLSAEYPFIYAPMSYLKAQEPVAMRYGEPAIDCSHRSAPGLSAAAKGIDLEKLKAEAAEKSAAKAASPTPTPQPSPSPQAAASPTPKSSPAEDDVITAAAPAYPVPDNAPAQVEKGGADFTKAPDEVVGYFRNQYNFVPDSHRFFDPIFEPAQPSHTPQGAQAGPPSTATYVEKP
jgi:hypothetical protein